MSQLLKFIEHSVTYFHAVDEARRKLVSHGFTELDEENNFSIKPKGKYFVVRDDSALIAFIAPSKKTIKGARILLSHVDSPGFRIKLNGEHQKDNMVLLGLESYGSPIYSTWLNRDLGLAGRIFVEENNQIKKKFVKIDEAPLIITQLPIHLDRKVNSEGLKLNMQEQFNALATLRDEKVKTSYLETLLKKHVKFKKLIHHELFLYPLEGPRFLGPDQNIFASPRIDNLMSVSACLDIMEIKEKAVSSNYLDIVYLASHEEIGSTTFSGADSPFFKSILDRIFYQYNLSFDEMQQALAGSFALSLDGSHALDPKNEDRFEPRHTPLLGEGVVIKIDSGASYANHGELIATLRKLADHHQIKIQNYIKKGDERQGSTIGPIFTKNLGIKTLDLGFSQLSMHALREVASCRDYDQLVKLLSLILKD